MGLGQRLRSRKRLCYWSSMVPTPSASVTPSTDARQGKGSVAAIVYWSFAGLAILLILTASNGASIARFDIGQVLAGMSFISSGGICVRSSSEAPHATQTTQSGSQAPLAPRKR